MTLDTAKKFLSGSVESGALGKGRAESKEQKHHGWIATLISIPWRMMIMQLIWSCAVTGAVYFVNEKSNAHVSTFSTEYWQPPFSVSSAVVAGVGWGLFVLLGFFISESSGRYTAARNSFLHLRHQLVVVIRLLKQNIPKGFWHDGDHDRIVAHLVAFPVVLKMALRGEERDRSQLEPILSKKDIDDILAAKFMPLHCTRVVRAYFAAIHDLQSQQSSGNGGHGQENGDKSGHSSQKNIGLGATISMIRNLDAINDVAVGNLEISEFAPSLGYVNHLRVFMYIWFFFLPLSFIQASGWFTPLVSLLITYGIGMMFRIADALNDPFGFDLQDIRLNRVSAEDAFDALSFYTDVDVSLPNLVTGKDDMSSWLSQPFNSREEAELLSPKPEQGEGIFLRLKVVALSILGRTFSKTVFIPLFLFSLWVAIVNFAVWKLDVISRASANDPTCRWWCPYIPISEAVSANLSLGLFLLLGFWLEDCYDRYQFGLNKWHTSLRESIDHVTNLFVVAFRRGTWHEGDRERILSHLACIPYAAKAMLRNSRDMSEVESMLSVADYEALCTSKRYVNHLFNIVNAYYVSADSKDAETLESGTSEMGDLTFGLGPSLGALEMCLSECESHRFISLPPNIFAHVRLLIFFWLALLPFSLVDENGPLSFIFLIPIAYSVITLFVIGAELADPYGTDEHDLPLDKICSEIKANIRQVYRDAGDESPAIMRDTGYSRDSLKPKPATKGKTGLLKAHSGKPTLRKSLQNLLSLLPAVPFGPMFIATVWTVFAVYLSWRLSFFWDADKRGQCRQWCSPIDLDSGTLGNIGFALFLILSFRASDGIGRYESGGKDMYMVEKGLRDLGVEFCLFIKGGFFHDADKERFVALLAQLPLSMRDALLQIKRPEENRVGILSDEDWKTLRNHPSPIKFLLRTIETYILNYQMTVPNRPYHKKILKAHCFWTSQLLARVGEIRTVVSEIYRSKRFPIAKSYVNHQQSFTTLWIMLLPLAMTSWTGWFTILWAPIICFGVFALEDIAVKLVDPFGTDDIDIPVDEMCQKASNSVIEAAWAVDWGHERHSDAQGELHEPYIGAVIEGSSVTQKYTLPHFEISQNTAYGTEMWFSDVSEVKAEPSLYAHFLQSVPWLVLFSILIWTFFCSLISYWMRYEVDNLRWWKSRVSISQDVAAYLSIAAFTPLGFYVGAAYSRYNHAGGIWTNSLRSMCHTAGAIWMTMFPENLLSEADRDRIMAHIAAIPIALKLELRDMRDVRELKGLLSNSDLSAIQCAENMTAHCIYLLRSYHYKLLLVSKQSDQGNEWKFHLMHSSLMIAYATLERTVSLAKFIKEFSLAPGFIVVVNAMLGIWFMFLPFVLAEISGWFTILWVPLVAYGMLGMYSVAEELQQPFGTDLNDLDLDVLAYDIVHDVLSMQHEYRHGTSDLLVDTPFSDSNSRVSLDSEGPTNLGGPTDPKITESLKIAVRAASRPLLAGLTAWTIIAIFGSLAVNNVWKLPPNMIGTCSAWCSRIAVDGTVSGYVGFALFLLLGFRLVDSHSRYMTGVKLWVGGLNNQIDLIAQRIFQTIRPGTFHKGDISRISGHLGAIGITLVARLRNEDCGPALRELLSDSDALRIERSADPVNHCIDVVRAYIMDADRQVVAGSVDYDLSVVQLVFSNLGISDVEDLARRCEEVINVPLPYGYVQHLRIFIAIWLVILPLGLVESAGYVTILWVLLIGYGILGIEHWATELSDPFGYDASDIPLEVMQARFIGFINRNRMLFQNGAQALIHKDRKPFNKNIDDLEPVFFGEKSALLYSKDRREHASGYGL